MPRIQPASPAKALFAKGRIQIAQILLIQKGTSSALALLKGSFQPPDGTIKPSSKLPGHLSIAYQGFPVDGNLPSGAAGVLALIGRAFEILIIVRYCVQHNTSPF